MRCEEVAVLLDAFRSSELSVARQEQVGAHLQSCEWCQAALKELRRTASLLALFQERAPESLCQDVLVVLGDHLGLVETRLGPVWVGFNARGVTFISLQQADQAAAQASYRRRLGREATLADVPARFARAVVDAAEGRWSRDIPLCLEGLPEFERTVLEKMRTIPLGEVRPYAWLAAEAGSPRAVRAVGNIMNRNPIPLLLPCHRVVPSSGGIGNYALGSGIKRTLLEREGVSTESIDELARQRVRYLGSDTTRIYCYPTCRDARRIQPNHRVPFTNEADARAAGYRPCKHCRPLAVAV